MREPVGLEKRAEWLFQRASDLAGDERRAFLEKQCAEDGRLRQRVEALLRHAEAASPSFLDHGAVPPPVDTHPSRIGAFRVLHPLGEGGMGIVYAAEQDEPVRRSVAIKLIKVGMDTREVLRRFEAERQALAILDHPNIARIFDAGETDDGRPHFVMERVDGVPLHRYCAARPLSLRQRLELLLPVVEAVQHAHQKGIIHRDLKPSNILVTDVGGRPFPKVIDFGIAKAAFGQSPLQTSTVLGAFLGTPEYMSPEQAGVGGLDVDTRSDIYSLGVILFEILTGTLPHSREELESEGWPGAQRVLGGTDSPRPSERLQTLEREPPGKNRARGAAQRSVLPRDLRGDLDWIVLKAVDKDRQRRYQSAVELADDIRRFLADRPVLAGPPTRTYRFKKFARRNRGVLFAAGAVFLAIVTAAGALSFALVESIQHRRSVEAALEEAEAVTAFLTDMLVAVDPAADGADVTVREILDGVAGTLPATFDGRPQVEARLAHTLGVAYDALGEYPSASPHLEHAVETYESILGLTDPRTLEATTSLARSRARQADYAAAESLYTSAIERYAMEDGTHRNSLSAQTSLADLYTDTARFQEAEALYRSALDSALESLGENDAVSLAAMTGLGTLYRTQARYADAESLYMSALSVARRQPGNRMSLVTALNNLAVTHRRQDRPGQAEPLLIEALDILRRTSGETHPSTLVLMSNLATFYSSQDRYAESDSLNEFVLEHRLRLLGGEHPSVLITMNNLAIGQQRQGRLAEAESLLVRILETREAVLGPDHPQVVKTMMNLAEVYESGGRFADAERAYRETLARRIRVHGSDSPFVPFDQTRLGRCLTDGGRVAEASTVLAAAVDGQRRFGTRPAGLAFSLYEHARCLLRMDRSADAEAALLEAYDVWVAEVGQSHSRTLETARLLVGLYDRENRPVEKSRWQGILDHLQSP